MIRLPAVCVTSLDQAIKSMLRSGYKRQSLSLNEALCREPQKQEGLAVNVAHVCHTHILAPYLCVSLLPQVVTCSRGHELSMLSLIVKWGCNVCSSPYSYNPRLRCSECDFDLCNECAKMQVCGDI